MTNNPESAKIANSGSLGLALEVIGREGSVCLYRVSDSPEPSCCILSQLPLRDQSDSRAAATLAPAIEQILNAASENGIPCSISAVAVAAGPGSFTGLRVAIATAKALAYAWQSSLIAVDSLAAIAAATTTPSLTNSQIQVAIGAYRGQVYRGGFEWYPNDSASSTSQLRAWQPSEIVSLDQWQSECRDDCHAAGQRKWFPDNMSEERWRDDDTCWAVGVARVASQVATSPLATLSHPMHLVPNYLRPSAAEEASETR